MEESRSLYRCQRCGKSDYIKVEETFCDECLNITSNFRKESRIMDEASGNEVGTVAGQVSEPMLRYIGVKIIDAEPMSENAFNELMCNDKTSLGREGYKVVYENGYVSWSPKDVLEKAYLPMGHGNKNTITISMVEQFIASLEVTKLGEKTTVVKAVLNNGFIIVESSSCVDPANYDEKIGRDVCVGRIKNKIWEFLGFMLQTAINGVQPVEVTDDPGWKTCPDCNSEYPASQMHICGN